MWRNNIVNISLVSIIILTVYTLYTFNDTITIKTNNNFVVKYMPNVSGVSVYEELSSNTMKCNLTTVSNIISNMLLDNYAIARDVSEGHMLDITMYKNEEEYRMLYNRKTRDFLCMSNPYFKNYVPQTYISVD